MLAQSNSVAQVYTLSVPDPLNPVHGRFPMHDCDFVHELVQRLTSEHGHGQLRCARLFLEPSRQPVRSSLVCVECLGLACSQAAATRSWQLWFGSPVRIHCM